MAFILRQPTYTLPWVQNPWYRHPMSMRTWTWSMPIDNYPAAAAQEFMPGQYDYPLPPPPVYPVNSRTGYQNLVILTPATVILRQNYWPGPILPRQPTPFQFPNVALLATAAPAAAEFMPGQYDYPLPERLPWPISARTWLSQKAPEEAAPPPFFETDWPLPIRPQWPTSARTWLFSNVHVIGARPTNQYDWPLPVRSPWPGFRGFTQSVITGESGNRPFNKFDWPLPIPPVFPVSGRTWLQPVIREAAAAIIPPQYSTLLPPSRLFVPAPFNPQNTTLLTAAPLVPVYDYALPALPRRGELTWINQGIREVSGDRPFNKFDWPMPRVPVQPGSVRTWIDQTKVALATVTPPIAQYDWPLPQRPQYPTSARTWLQATVAVLGARPYNQYDWPLPRVAAQPISSRTWIQPPITSVSGDQPFNQYDWPLPDVPPPVASQRTWIWNAQIQLAPPVPNIAQYDWPVPQRPPLVASQKGYLQGSITSISGDSPFNEYDWPLPLRPFFPTSGRSWIWPSQNQLTPATPPIAQFDWPVPGRPPVVSSQRNWIQGVIWQISGDLPKNQYDWPGPRVAPLPVSARSWLQARVHIIGARPASQYDWPVPKAPQFPISGRFYRDSIKLSLIEAVRPRVYDWPLPRRPEFPASGRTLINRSIWQISGDLPKNQYNWPQAVRIKYTLIHQ